MECKRVVTPTKNHITSIGIFKRSLSTSCLMKNTTCSSTLASHTRNGMNIAIHRNVHIYRNPLVPGLQSRGYKFVTSASASSQNEHDQDKTNRAHSSNEDTRPPEEVQKELDSLLATAYTKAKQISLLVTTRRNPSQEHARMNTTHTAIFAPTSTIQEESRQFRDDTDDDADDDTDADVDIVLGSIDASTEEKLNAAWETLDIQDEINAVEALLSMTSHPNFHKALAQQRTDADALTESMNVSLSLHSAFLSVISWLSSTLSNLPTVEEREESVNLLSPSPHTEISVNGPTKQSILLTHVLHLSERSRELNLPLTIPQYKTIASMIAKHSSSMDESLSILDLSTTVSELYSCDRDQESESLHAGGSNTNILQAHFFSGALRELLKRNKLRDMVELLHGMQNIHHIDNIDLQTGMELLNMLKKKVDETMSSGAKPAVGFDETDAMELAMILQRPVLDELQSKRKELEDYQDQIGETMGALMDREQDQDDGNFDIYNETDKHDLSHKALDSSNTDSNALSKEEHDGGNDPATAIHDECDGDGFHHKVSSDEMDELNEMTKRLKTLEGDEAADLVAKSSLAAKAILDKIHNTEEEVNTNDSVSVTSKNPPKVSARFHVDPSSGEVENVEFTVTLQKQPSQFSSEDKKKYDDMYQGMIRDVVYCRDETWQLGDVVPQLEEWNGARGLTFSKEFEAEILEERTGEDLFDDDVPPDDSGNY